MASMLRPCTRLRQPPGASPLSLPIPRALARAASSNPARRPPTGPRALTSPPAPPPATRPAQPQPQPQPQLQPQSQTQTQSPARKLPIPKWSIVPPPSGEPFPAPSRADATLPFWTAPTAHPSTGPGPGADPDPEPADPAGREIHQLAGIAPAAAERLCDALGVGMDWLAGVLSAAHDRKRPLDDVLAAAEGTRGKGGPGEALPRIALLVKDNKRFFAIKERLLRAALHNAPRHRAGRLLQQLVALKKADRLIAPSAPTVLAWHELDEEISRFVRAQAPGALTARAQAALGEMEDDAAAGMLSRARVRELVLRARHALEREVKDHPGPDSARAMTMLGNLWAEGRMGRAGSKKGQRTLRKECRYWWAKAAKLGHAPAISRLVFELSPLAAVDRYGERLLRAFPKLALAHASRLVLPKAWGGSLSAQFYYTDRALAPEEHRRRWGVLPDDAEAAERFAWAGRRGDGRGKLGWARMMLFGRAGLGDGRRWMARWEREWRAWWERGEAGGEEDMVPGTGDGGAGVERAREAREAKKARRAEAAGAEAEEDEGLEEDEDEDEWDEMEEDPGQESQERNIDQDEEVERRLTHLSAEVERWEQEWAQARAALLSEAKAKADAGTGSGTGGAAAAALRGGGYGALRGGGGDGPDAEAGEEAAPRSAAGGSGAPELEAAHEQPALEASTLDGAVSDGARLGGEVPEAASGAGVLAAEAGAPEAASKSAKLRSGKLLVDLSAEASGPPLDPAELLAKQRTFPLFDADGRAIAPPLDRAPTRLEVIECAIRLLDAQHRVDDGIRKGYAGLYRLAMRLLEEAKRGEPAMPTESDWTVDRFRTRNSGDVW